MGNPANETNLVLLEEVLSMTAVDTGVGEVLCELYQLGSLCHVSYLQVSLANEALTQSMVSIAIFLDIWFIEHLYKKLKDKRILKMKTANLIRKKA